MISVSGVNDDVLIWGRSTDDKPRKVDGYDRVPNGCIFVSIDTKELWVYDKEKDVWVKWSS